ncbi:MAG: DUF2846 domain-containing protein [Candidatus Omnitrophota bacterium]
MKKQILILSLLGMVISGCATYATGPLFSQAPASPTDKGTLYVFRSKASVGALIPTVKLNGKPFVNLTAMGYSYAYVTPGVYQLTFEKGSFKYFITEIEIKAGENLYVEYNEPFSMLREIPESKVSEAVKNYKYVDPSNISF